MNNKHKKIERDRERQRDRETERDRERQRERDRERDRERKVLRVILYLRVRVSRRGLQKKSSVCVTVKPLNVNKRV